MADDNLKRIEDLNRQVQEQLEKVRRQFGMLYGDENEQCPRQSLQNSPQQTSSPGTTPPATCPRPQERPPASPIASSCARRLSPVTARAPSPAREQLGQENAAPKPEFWTEVARVRREYHSVLEPQEETLPPSPTGACPPCTPQQPRGLPEPLIPIRLPQPRPPSPEHASTPLWPRPGVSPPQQMTVPSRTPTPAPCPQARRLSPVAARTPSPVQLQQSPQQIAVSRTPSPRPAPCPSPQQITVPRTPPSAPCPSSPGPVRTSPCPRTVSPPQQPRGSPEPLMSFRSPQTPQQPRGLPEPLIPYRSPQTPQQPRGLPEPLIPYRSPQYPEPQLPPPMVPTSPQRPYVIPSIPRGPRTTAEQERAQYMTRGSAPPLTEDMMYWATAAASQEAEAFWNPQYSSYPYNDDRPLPNPFIQDEAVEEFDPLYSGAADRHHCPGHWTGGADR